MPADAPRRGRAVTVPIALGLSAAYALGAGATTPFTWAADFLTGIPIVVVLAGAVACWPARPDRQVLTEQRVRHPYLPWVTLFAVVVAWELAEYLARGGRGAHPTLSSMADAFDHQQLAKSCAFLAWLWIGAAIVRAGTPHAAGRVESDAGRL